MIRTFAPLLAIALSACATEIEVLTDPVSTAIPVTSIQSPVYAEIAVDIPPEAQGALADIEFQLLEVLGRVVNPSDATSMDLGLRLSFEGTAEPGGIYAFTELTRPEYFARSIELLPAQTFGPGTSTPFVIEHEALRQIVTRERIWLIVSNTVTRLGFGDLFPQEVRLEDVQVHTVVVKSFDGFGGVQELSGL